MNCFGSRAYLLRLAGLAVASTLVAVGCGGSVEMKKDGGRDGGGETPAMLSPSAPTLNLGGVIVNRMGTPQPLTITNTGAATSSMITVSVTGDFTSSGCMGSTLARNASCTVMVTFAPKSVAQLTGTLTVSAAMGGTVSVALSGTGLSETALVITPESRDFGDVAVGQMSAAVTFTVRNPNPAPVTMLANSISGGDFIVPAMGDKCTGMLAANASCQIDVVFRPMSEGAKSATLISTGTGAAQGMAALRGSGFSPARLAWNPMAQSINGNVNETTGPITYALVNEGDRPSGTPTVTLGGANAAEFTMNNRCVAPIPAGGSCLVDVSFKPTMTGMRTATLNATATPGGMNVMATINGTAGTGSQITADPSALSFGDQQVGSPSGSRAVMIRNTGMAASGPLTVNSSSGEFAVTGNCAGMSLAPAGMCTLSVVFTPSAAGERSGNLTIAGGSGAPRVVSLSGTGVAAPRLVFSPPSRDFGTVPVMTESADFTFTVTNEGGAIPSGVTAAITGVGAGHFRISGSTCTGALAAGATCNVVVRFQPQSMGDKLATVSVTGGAASGSANVTGIGGATGSLMITQIGAGVFSDTVVGFAAMGTLSFNVVNTGMGPSGMIAIDLVGTDADSFSQMNTCSTLAPGGNCMVTVTLRPTKAGPLQASLRATASGGVALAGLTATGLAQIQLAPTMEMFGDVPLGTMGPTRAFVGTVRAPLTGGTATITTGMGDYNVTGPAGCTNGLGAPVDSTSYTGVMPGDSNTYVTCAITVTFFPRTTKGPKPGVLTYAAGGQSATAALSGTAASTLTITPKPFDFGTRMTGSSTTQTFTVTNTGTAVVSITSTTLSGAEFAKGTGAGDTCSAAMVAAGATCTIDVTFAPTTAGPKTATLTVSGSAAGAMETDTVTINGVGVGPVPLITVTPTPGAFGDVALTASKAVSFTVTNPPAATGTGTITVNAPTSTDFTVTANTCGMGGTTSLPPGGTCTFTVTFTPSIAAAGTGARTADIDIDAAGVPGNPGGTVTVALTGNATQPLASVTASHDFGSVVQGDLTGPTRTFDITNAGAMFAVTTDLLDGSAPGADATDYIVVTGCTMIPAGGMCQATVRFAPNSLGPSSAILRVRDGTGRAIATSTLSGTGVSDAVLEWVNIDQGGPHTRDFGDVRVVVPAETSETVTFTLRNTGAGATGALSFNAPFMATDPFILVDGSTCSGLASLAGGDTCTVQVRFRPTAVGPASRMLSVSAPGKVAGSTKTSTPAITLEGTGVAGTGALYITPTAVDTGEAFGGGTAAAPVTLTFRNNTMAAVTLTGIAASNGTVFKTPAQATGGGRCVVGEMVAGTATCTFQVVLNPDMGSTPGIQNTEITVTTSGGGATASAYGRVRGNARLTFAPAVAGTLAFGDAVTGTAVDRSWTVTNSGERESGAITAPISAEMPGGDTSFSVVNEAGSCIAAASSNVPAGGSCTLKIRFQPGTTGAKGATFTVDSPNNDGPATPIAVSGTGVGPSIITSSAPALTFADTMVNASSATQTVTIRNVAGNPDTQASGPLMITVSSTNFTATGCDTERMVGLAGGATCDLTVTFTPKSAGMFTADTISVAATPGSSISIGLSGTGTP